MNYRELKKDLIGIYKITSPSGKIYIGKSKCIRSRFMGYVNMHNVKGQVKLHRSFNKYGVENHVFEVIEECEFEELNIRERYWQDYYEVINENGLNCLLTSTNDKPFVFSEETLKKKSEAVKGSKHPNYGKKLSKETIEKMSKNRKGRILTQEHKDKISKTTKGRKMPPNCIKSGLDNHKSIAIKSTNTETNESFILNLADTLRYFKCDRELVINRAKKISGVKSFRKHKEWIFEIL